MHPEKWKYNKGATLIEVLVSFVILMIAMTPAFYVARSSMVVASTIRDNLTAASLAQEGLEVARSIRDANWFNGVAFNTGLSNGTYQVEWNSAALVADTDAYIRLNTSGLYTYSLVNSAATPFKRKITVTNVMADEIRLQSVVTWNERGVNKSVTAETILFNWR